MLNPPRRHKRIVVLYSHFLEEEENEAHIVILSSQVCFVPDSCS